MIEVRRATEADCAQMPAFRIAMEGGDFLRELRDEAFYRYKYLRAGFAYVARDGGRLVGVTAAVPRQVRLGPEVVPAADLGDLFVHPEARGRGLFRRLHEAVVSDLADASVRLATVRAGAEAVPILEGAFGYRRLFRVAESAAALTPEGRATLPLGRVPLLRALLPRHRPRAARDADGWTTRLTDPAGLPPAKPADALPAGVVRDADRIRARYTDDPGPYAGVVLERDGTAVGSAVLLVYAGREFVVDLWLPPHAGEGGRVLARAALAALRERGAGVAWFWSGAEAGTRDAGLAALRAEGLRVVRRSKGVLGRVLGAGETELPPADEWLFRMGDTDGI